MKSAIKCK